MFALGAKIDSSFGKSFSRADKQFQKTQRQANAANKAFEKTDKMLKNLAITAAGYVGFSAAKSFFSECVEGAKAQIDAEVKLRTVLKERTNATDEQIKSILNLTAAQQELGVIGDEVQIAGAQQIGTFVNSTNSVKTLIPAMNNLLAQQKGLNATQQDAVNVGNMIGKVLQGQVGALTRVGITFTEAQEKVMKFGTEQERAAMIAEVITGNVGEVNAALAQHDQGKIQNTTNAWGDMKEVLGAKLLPIIAEYAVKLGDKIPVIQEKLIKIINKTVAVYNTFAKVIDWTKQNADWLIPVMGGLAASFAAFTVIGTIKKMLDLWRASTLLMTIAQGGLNAVLLANPIGLVVVGIGLLVAAGIAVYRNWDKIKTKATEIWAAIKDTFSGVGEWFSGVWNGIVEGFQGAWKGISGFFTSVFEGVVSIFKGYVNTWIRIANFLIGGLNKIKFDVPDWVPGLGGKKIGINIPKIPALAMGGIAVKPTLAMIGEGREKEAVLPLSKLNSMLNISNNESVKNISNIANAKNIEHNGCKWNNENIKNISNIVNHYSTVNSIDKNDSVFSLSKLETELKFPSTANDTKSVFAPVFSPQVTIQGNADEDIVNRGLDMSFEKFKMFMKKYNRDQDRLEFSGG